MKLKRVLKSVIPPLCAGIVGSIFMLVSNIKYEDIIKPKFAPPAIMFPIVWSVLYVMIAITTFLYLGSDKVNEEDKSRAMVVLYLDMFLNAFWTFFYFYLGAFLFSSIWLLLMIVVVSSRIIIFYKGNKISGLLNILYLAWLLIAIYLNISTFLLN